MVTHKPMLRLASKSAWDSCSSLAASLAKEKTGTFATGISEGKGGWGYLEK